MLEIIEQLGFSRNEAIVYIELLHTKKATAVQLSKKTKLHRRTIYDNLNLLSMKGVVSSVKETGSTYFIPCHPKNLLSELDSKRASLEKIMPALESLYMQDSEEPEVELIRGKDGILRMLHEAQRKNESIYWIGAGGILFSTLGDELKGLDKSLRKLDIRMVQPSGFKSKLKIKNLRILPKTHSLNSTVAIAVFGDVVAIGSLEGRDVTIVKIRSASYAKAFKNYFDILWSISKKK